MNPNLPTHAIAHILWKYGIPKPETLPVETCKCAFCGDDINKGISMKWFSGTFTNAPECQYLSSPCMCVYCATMFNEKAIVDWHTKPYIKLRNYSHIFIDNKWFCVHAKLSDGKEKIRNILQNPPKKPWIIAISETGQKHILFRAKWSPGGKKRIVVQFEETSFNISSDEIINLCMVVDKLRKDKYTKDEIIACKPNAVKLSKNIDNLKLFDKIKTFKQSRQLMLAYILSMKG